MALFDFNKDDADFEKGTDELEEDFDEEMDFEDLDEDLF